MYQQHCLEKNLQYGIFINFEHHCSFTIPAAKFFFFVCSSNRLSYQLHSHLLPGSNNYVISNKLLSRRFRFIQIKPSMHYINTKSFMKMNRSQTTKTRAFKSNGKEIRRFLRRRVHSSAFGALKKKLVFTNRIAANSSNTCQGETQKTKSDFLLQGLHQKTTDPRLRSDVV